MPRTAITVQTAAAYGGKLEDATFTLVDNPNGNQFVHPGGDVLLIVYNPTGGALAVTVPAVAFPGSFNRGAGATNDIVITTAATPNISLMAIPDKGFNQGLGVVHIDPAALLTVAIIKMTKTP